MMVYSECTVPLESFRYKGRFVTSSFDLYYGSPAAYAIMGCIKRNISRSTDRQFDRTGDYVIWIIIGGFQTYFDATRSGTLSPDSAGVAVRFRNSVWKMLFHGCYTHLKCLLNTSIMQNTAGFLVETLAEADGIGQPFPVTLVQQDCSVVSLHTIICI